MQVLQPCLACRGQVCRSGALHAGAGDAAVVPCVLGVGMLQWCLGCQDHCRECRGSTSRAGAGVGCAVVVAHMLGSGCRGTA